MAVTDTNVLETSRVRDSVISWMPDDLYIEDGIIQLVTGIAEELQSIFADITSLPLGRSITQVPSEFLSNLEFLLALDRRPDLPEEERRRRLLTITDFIRIKGTESSFNFWFFYYNLRMTVIDLFTDDYSDFVAFEDAPLGDTTFYATPHFALRVDLGESGFIIDTLLDFDAVPKVETVGSGDGSTSIFNFDLYDDNVNPSTVSLDTLVGAAPFSVVDDGVGGFIAQPGTIDYVLGDIVGVGMSTPDNGADIVASYTFTNADLPAEAFTLQDLLEQLQKNVKPAETVLEFILLVRELTDVFDSEIADLLVPRLLPVAIDRYSAANFCEFPCFIIGQTQGAVAWDGTVTVGSTHAVSNTPYLICDLCPDFFPDELHNKINAFEEDTKAPFESIIGQFDVGDGSFIMNQTQYLDFARVIVRTFAGPHLVSEEEIKLGQDD